MNSAKRISGFRFPCLILVCVFILCSTTPVYSTLFEGAVIEGLSLEKIEQGKTLYLIKAAEATFSNKRIGFFSTPFIKVINLKDVEFKLYSDGCLIKSLHFEVALYEIYTRSLFDGEGNLIFRE